MNYDVVVVGGGICGLASAGAAARKGANVLLVEKESAVGHEASGRAAGSLRLQGRHPAEFPLAQEAISIWKSVDDGSFEVTEHGNMYLATRAEERKILGDLARDANESGLADVRLLSTAGLENSYRRFVDRLWGRCSAPWMQLANRPSQ